jgi:hypothetical protein
MGILILSIFTSPNLAQSVDQNATAKSEPITGLKGLEGLRMPDESWLIKSGFPYDNKGEIEEWKGLPDFTVDIVESTVRPKPTELSISLGSIDKKMAFSVSVAELNKFSELFKGKSEREVFQIANNLMSPRIGVTWRFLKAQSSFHWGDYVYTALRAGSMIIFHEAGVLLVRFKITPYSDYKKSK